MAGIVKRGAVVGAINLALGAAILCAGSHDVGAGVLTKRAQSEPAGYAAVHAGQGLGKILVAPDSSFVLYEWGRPYLNWAPDVSWIAGNAGRRLNTFLYRSDIPVDEPASTGYLFEPNGGATYWLGDLSPTAQYVAVYELDHDDRRVRAGAWDLQNRKVVWFTPRVDESRLEQVTAWISPDEFLFPVKDKSARLARANVKTAEASLCPACSNETVTQAASTLRAAQERAKSAVSDFTPEDLPAGAKLVAGADNADLAVYVKDDASVLELMYKRRKWPLQVLFENPRQWPRPAVAGASKSSRAGE